MNTGSRFAYWSCASVMIAECCLAQTPPAQAAAPPAEAPPPRASAAQPFTSPHDWYDLDAPTSPDHELDEIFAPHVPMFRVPIIDGPMNALLDAQRKLEEETGLRVGLVYTHVFQQATGGPGTRWGSAGDLDLMLDWTLVGRGTEDTGRFFFSIEERFQAGEATPAQLRGEIGTLVGTAGAFNDRGFVIRDAFWDQRFLDARLRVLIGRAAPDDYVGSHRLQSTNFGFFNGNLSGNVTTTFVGHGPLALVSVHPTETFYATAGAANAFSTTTQSNLNTLDEWQVYGFGEIGVTPEIEGLGRGRYAVTGWNIPGRDRSDLASDWGLSFTLEQYLRDDLWVYARYGFADRGLTGVDQAWQAAVAIDGLLGSPENVTGLGFGYAEPSSDSARDETSIDAFHRFQLLEHVQFTLGAQLFINPGNAPDDDAIGVFSARLRLEF